MKKTLFTLYATDNLFRILRQLGTFNAHYTKCKNEEAFVFMLHQVYKETAVHCWAIEPPIFWLHRCI